MPHYGTLRDYKFKEAADDVRGAELYGRNNEKLGKVEDVIFDHGECAPHYAVVDSGGWLKSRKFLVPAGRMRGYDRDGNALHVDLAKENIERLPAYDERFLESEKDWSGYQDRYLESWRHACDIGGTELAMTGEMDERCETPPTQAGVSAALKPERWSRFENLVQRNRADILRSCSYCERDRKAA